MVYLVLIVFASQILFLLLIINLNWQDFLITYHDGALPYFIKLFASSFI